MNRKEQMQHCMSIALDQLQAAIQYVAEDDLELANEHLWSVEVQVTRAKRAYEVRDETTRDL